MGSYRIPSEYADQVIITGLAMAMIRVNDKLAPVKRAIEDAGYNSLTEYTDANAQSINGQKVLLLQYTHAVFTRAKAGLLQQFNSLNRKEEAENAAKESGETEQYWLNESQASIKAFFDLFLPDETTLSSANAHVTLL